MVLTIDPSFSATGWALVNGVTVVDSGCFRLPKVSAKSKTAEKIGKQKEYLSQIYALFGTTPSMVYCEYPHGGQDLNAAWSFAVTTGAVIAAARHFNVPVYFCLESQAKKALLGRSKNVIKAETRQKIVAYFGKYGYIEDKRKYVAEAVADALAVYLYFYVGNKAL